MTDEEKLAQEKAEQEANEKFDKLQKDYNAQQEKIKELEKYKGDYESTKRRAEKAEKALKGKADPEEVNEWKQKFEIEHENIEKARAELSKLKNVQKQNSVLSTVNEISNYSDNASNLLTIALNAQSRLEGDNIVVVDNAGQIRLNRKTMQPMSLQDLRDEIISQTPSMLKAKVDGGSGTTGNNGSGMAISVEDYESKPAPERAKILSQMSEEQRNNFLNQ